MNSLSYTTPEVSYSHWGTFKDDRPMIVNVTINVAPTANREEIGRTMYQSAQKMAMAVRAAGG